MNKTEIKNKMKLGIKTTKAIITDDNTIKELNMFNEFITAVDNVYNTICNSKIKNDTLNSVENKRKKEIAARKLASYIKEYYKK